MAPLPLLPSIKASLLTLAAISHRVGLKAPNPPPSNEAKDAVYRKQPFEKVVRPMALISQVFIISCLMSGCAVLFALYYKPPYADRIFERFCPRPTPAISTISMLTPPFLLGIVSQLYGAALRVWCFKALGSLFTLEINIKPEHKLITTGPYAYVRHPSYTASVLMIGGAALSCFGPGSYVTECQILATPAGWAIRLWMALTVFAVVSLWRRGGIEDEKLKEAFGEAWDRYSQAVPCKFVPGLI